MDLPDIEEYWKGAESLLDKHYKAKRRRITFWRFTFALLAIGGIVFFSLDNATFNVQTSEITNSKVKVLSSKHNNNTKSNAEDIALLSKKQTDISSSLRGGTTNQTQIKSDSFARSVTPNDMADVASQRLQTHISSSLRAGTTEQTQINVYSSTRNVNKKDISEVASINSQQQNINYETVALITPSQLEKELAVENGSDSKTENLDTDLKTFSSLKKEKIAFQILSLNNYFFDGNNLNNGIVILSLPIDNLKTTIDDYAQNKSKLNFSVSGYFGMQQVSKKLSSNAENMHYVARRTNEEAKTNQSFYGINFSISKNRLQLQTGFEYNTFGEKNNYESLSKQWQVSDLSKWNTYTTQVAVVDTVYYFGIKSYKTNYKTVTDSSYQSQYDSIYTNTKNNKIAEANTKTKISYIEIPLMIGYQFTKNKFAITPLLGISAGYLVTKKGMYLNKTLTDIENISDNKNFKNFMLNYCFQLQISCNINRRFAVYLSPQYKANAMSVTNKTFGVNTFYKTYGGLVGINYKIK